MKILYVITKANWGGAQKYVYDLATASKAAGNEVTVAYGEEGLLVSNLAAAGVRTLAVHGMQNKASWGALADARRALYALFADEQPDIVHLNSSLASAAGASAARKAGVARILFTAHGWAFNEDRSFLQKKIIKFFAWRTIRLSHATICVSEAVRRDIAWMPFITKKLVVVHNGIECKELRTRADARATLLPGHEHKTWIGIVSELHPTKRIIDALHAMKDLIALSPKLILVVLGDGSERAHLEELIGALGLRERVFLLGFVADAPQYEKAFDIFLHPSRSEALAYAILEAGCASLPVVACKVGGIPEIIENGMNGLLVPPENPARLADALEALITNPERSHTLGAALHQTVTTQFSKSEMVRKTLALY